MAGSVFVTNRKPQHTSVTVKVTILHFLGVLQASGCSLWPYASGNAQHPPCGLTGTLILIIPTKPGPFILVYMYKT